MILIPSYLSSEIIQEWSNLDDAVGNVQPKIAQINSQQLLKLALEIAAFFMSHNAEADACDLLIELEALDKLPSLTDKVSYPRVCLYILG